MGGRDRVEHAGRAAATDASRVSHSGLRLSTKLTPAVGRRAAPAIPFPTPMEKPRTPSFMAPLTGSRTMPTTPDMIPRPSLVVPSISWRPLCFAAATAPRSRFTAL
eukprot:scaffold208251_cov30-Tisochrysis_lutea.AAC.1